MIATRLKQVFIVGVSCILLSGCQKRSSNDKSHRHVVSGEAFYYLSPPELTQAENLAEKGDSEACIKIFMHYELTQLDSAKADIYLRKAASLGSERAKLILKQREVAKK